MTPKLKNIEIQSDAHEKEEQKENQVDIQEELNQMKADILESAKKESDALLASAQNEHEKIIAQAYDEAMMIREKAKKEGYDIGKSEGLAVMKDKEKKVMEEALAHKNKCMNEYEAYLKQSETDIIELVLETCQKVLNDHIKSDEELIEKLVHKGIQKSIFTENVVIHVAENDYEKAVDSKAKILTFARDIKDIEFIVDYTLEPGDCILESENGAVDVSVSTQFQRIKEVYQSLVD